VEFSCELRDRARELADKGRFEESLAAIDRAIERNKLDPTAHYLRGVILHEQGREGEAAASLHRSLYLEPGFVLAHVTLGNIMRRGGKENAARRSFANALKLLGQLDRDAVLPESGGMTAGRLLQILSGPRSVVA
jgi:chemotaxis protein methyltransferase CheR